eukprot:572408-Pleurochrysis_carterae.AAC.1
MVALRIMGYILIDVSSRKEEGWHMTVFHEYDAKYRNARCDSQVHPRPHDEALLGGARTRGERVGQGAPYTWSLVLS